MGTTLGQKELTPMHLSCCSSVPSQARRSLRYFLLFALSVAVFPGLVFGQSGSIVLSSGTAANGAVALNLTLNAASGTTPAALQWTLNYSASDITSISATASTASSNAGKSLTCTSGSGSYTCVDTGLNTNTIANGVVAVVNVTIASTVSSTTINVSNPDASDPTGTALAMTGTGGTITAPPPPPATTVSSLACSPATINTPGSSSCTVTISAAAPTGGTAVALSSNSSSLAVPASVTVASGATSAAFTATASAVSSNQTAVVTASLNSTSATASIALVDPVLVSSLACSPTTLASGAGSSCTVTLSSAAPSGGTTVALSSNNGLLTVPASVAVAASSKTGTFTATAGTISSNQSATVTASLNSSSATATISLTAPVMTVSSVSCNPNSVACGSSTSCTLTLSGSAPSGGTTVTLSSNNSAVTVPASVSVAASSSSASFTANTTAVSSDETATVTAAFNGSSANAALTVDAASSETYSLWSSSAKPGTVTDSDSQAVELGVNFQANASGSVTGVRFYKGSKNTGTHVGHLWSKSGTLLASVTFTGETSSGWQQAQFSSPVSISANTTYIVSYWCPNGHYSADDNYFASSSVTNGPLTAPKNTSSAPNGIYHYGSQSFPTSTYESSNYWVDVLFVEGSASSQVVTAKSTSAGAGTNSRAAAGQPASASLSCSPRAVQPGQTFRCELNGGNAADPASVDVQSASAVVLPQAVTGRSGQHSLSFQGATTESAAPQSFTVSATRNGQTAEDTITVLPASGPAITVPGDQLVQSGSTVAFKVAVDPANPASLSAVGLPAGASFDPATGHFSWTPASRQSGSYDVKFAAKGVTGNSTASVHFQVGDQLPVVANASQISCSPGSMATLSGQWLGPNEPAADFTGASTTLAGTSVRVNGNAVPVLFADKTHAAFLCPSGLPGDALQVALETPAGAAAAFSTTMAAAAPGLLSTSDSQQGLAFHSGTAQLATAQDARTLGAPAQPGDSLTLLATGLDASLPTFVSIGGVPAEVSAIVPSPNQAGVWSVQVKVPSAASTGDAVPVQLTVASPNGRQLSSNTVTIAVESARQ